MSRLYARLVLSDEARAAKGFNARQFLEGQLQKSDSGPCLFVFDNFETTQNPLEVFTWIDTYIRLPNKALVTTRLRDFKGDYPVDVLGMNRDESIKLINQVSAQLGIARHLTSSYVEDLIDQSEGHPYVIKILLGEVAKTGAAGNIPRLVAGSDEILTALFERTYASLNPCAQRAFLTLSAWNSLVPRLALEAVLIRSTGERQQVESGIEALLNYSLAEAHIASADNQEFLSLPLVASVFGKKKLNISPQKTSILSDSEILQMLGPSRRDGIQLGLAKRVERFVAAIAKRCESGESYENYEPIIEMICRNYPAGWLVLARWHLELGSEDGLQKAKSELVRFLENEPDGVQVADAWRTLAFVCHRLGDTLGEVHAFVERAQLSDVPFFDVSNTANRLNQFLRDRGLELDTHEKQALAQRLATVMENRIEEADADDFSRMAWLAIHQGLEGEAQKYAAAGLEKDPENYHCRKLAGRLGLSD
jgi:tetratricopeptide (TPR) repeat protein